jgi:hypothetical protein
LALAILNPPPAERRRLSPTTEKEIRDAIRTVLSRAGADIEWVRRHFIYHRTASYLVIPNLYSCDPNNKVEAAKALAMNQFAGVLDDMDVVEWPDAGWPKQSQRKILKSELQKLKREEALPSDTDLTKVRQKWLEESGQTGDATKSETNQKVLDAKPIRNHGLFSKAERALSMAGWSEQARRDVEVLRIVDTDGLTPLLRVLNDPYAETSTKPEPPPAEASAAKA